MAVPSPGRQSRPREPALDRRLMPRPLPAHLASAMMLWASSRAALPSLSAGLPLSNQSPKLRALASEIAKAGLDHVAPALDRELLRRAEAFLAGLEAYRRHYYRRVETTAQVIWQEGATRLLDYGGTGPPVLLIPSLINRYYILDLLPERSFAVFLREQELRPLVVDWGEPGELERGFGLDDYIAGRLDRMLTAVSGGPVAILGYCMGGLLALALTLRRSQHVAGLALLATPWDFHAERPEQAGLIGTVIDVAAATGDTLPLSVIQGLFLSLAPFLGERKFARFSRLDPDSEAARDFVALQDWLNDGVPLARKVARECGVSWYRDNEPAHGTRHGAGWSVRPIRFDKP